MGRNMYDKKAIVGFAKSFLLTNKYKNKKAQRAL